MGSQGHHKGDGKVQQAGSCKWESAKVGDAVYKDPQHRSQMAGEAEGIAASEKHLITNNCHRWQEKLKEAVTDGDDVLLIFYWQTLNESSRNNDNQICTSNPVSYTKIAASSMVHYFHQHNGWIREYIGRTADTEKFLRLLQLDVPIDEDNTRAPTKGKKPVICNSSTTPLHQEEHQPLKRKRSFDSILDSNKMLESMKRAMRASFFFSILDCVTLSPSNGIA